MLAILDDDSSRVSSGMGPLALQTICLNKVVSGREVQNPLDANLLEFFSSCRFLASPTYRCSTAASPAVVLSSIVQHYIDA